MKILFVGGTWNDEGGKPSSLVNKFCNALLKNEGIKKLSIYNGGNYSELEGIINKANDYNVVFWWANVPNDKPKVRDVKAVNPKIMLITSKRNNGEYTTAELINRALAVKANLSIQFTKQSDKCFLMTVYDPLGNSWYEGTDIDSCCKLLYKRINYLRNITRQGCKQGNEKVEIPDNKEFFDIIKGYAEVFHNLIQPEDGVTRFLGNASFRCTKGFPSFRYGDIIFVSKRNVDKRYIDKDNFVPVKLINNEVTYYGENKPSVDTPIQVRLYDKLPNINYMIHSHTYVSFAPFTDNMVPCGGLEEVKEVINTLQKNWGNLDRDLYIVNLRGHGSLIMSSNIEQLKGIKYYGRELLEKQE